MVFLKTKVDDEAARVVQPLVNVRESDKEVVLEAEMVGLSREDISLELKDNELVITGRVREAEPSKGYTLIHRERCPFEYARSFVLGEMIDKEKIDAQYENGILKVVLPKTEAAHPKKIQIKG